MNLKYEYLSNKSLNYKHDLYVFNNIDDEINFMFSKIGELINSGIDMNNIYIFGVSKEYEIKLNRYSQLFNIALEISNKIRLISSPAYKKFYKYLDTMDYLDAYKRLEEETKYDPNLALDSIANILVEINSLKIDKYKFKDLLNYMAKNKYLKAINYKSSIKKASIDTVIGDNDYVFMPGFSLSIYPTIHLDTMYLSDLELNKLNRLDSNIRNKIEHDILKSFILNTKNLIISFKNKNGKSKYYKSLLANELGLNEINNIDINTLYSNKLMKLEMVKYNDLYYRYGIDNKYRNSYHVDIDYYEKKYIKSDKLKNDDEIVLSSTQLSSYFSCPYKYFVERVLKLRTSDSTFNLELGNLFHKIIEDSFTKDINLEDYNDLINEKFKTNKEKILVNNVINQTLDVIKLNNEFRRIHSFNKIMIEEELKIEIDDKTKLVGKIDCYMIDDESNVIIVDFKSGKTKFDEKKVKYGFDIQLPIYAWLMNHNHNELNITGIYLQKVCEDIKKEKKPYLLSGITNDGFVDILAFELDDNDESKYIKDLKKNKGKIKASTHDINELINIIENKIKEAIKDIRDANFEISPKTFNIQAPPCSYCNYKDMCNSNIYDIKVLKAGGEE